MPAISLTNKSDDMLAAGFREGDKRAFNRIYRDFAPALLGHVCRVVKDYQRAEKILHHAFLQIWDKRAEFCPERDKLFPWLLRCVKSTTAAYLERADKSNSAVNQNYLSSVYIEGNFEKNGVETHKKVLDLLYYNNYSLKEASVVLNVDEGQAKMMLRSALKTLKTLSNG